jgi:hypothetical protein
MDEKLEIEETMALQEQRLLVLRRQADRGQHFVTRRLKRAEHEYFACKHRVNQMRRLSCPGGPFESADRNDVRDTERRTGDSPVRIVVIPTAGFVADNN